MTSKRKAIQLDRCFIELSGDTEPPAAGSFAQFARTSSWEQVLSRPCSVILGEAGTGKTTEFRQRCDLLAASGSYAFLVTVEDLARDGLADSLTAPDSARLNAWLSSDDRAYLFLDSLDEARLNGQRFQTALRKLQRELGDRLVRAAILVSCRVSDWRADADRDAIATALYPEDPAAESQQVPSSPPPAMPSTSETFDLDLDGDGWADASSDAAPQQSKRPTAEQIPQISICALAPLDERQITLLAKDLGVDDPAPFVSAARRASAHAYLERPRDVEWIAAYWLQHGEFGTLTDLVENDVQEKLRERNPDRKPSLSAARAREAVQILAGIAALQRRSTFSLPDGDLDADRASNSIDPATYLPDLTKQEISELLSLAVFDESTYGRVRIHHRTVFEYLAAQWMLGLVQRGLSTAELNALLLRDGPNGPVVPQELVAVAAWVANANEELRRRLLEVTPTVLLDGGDPNAFPDDVRRELLLALAKKYQGRQRLYERFDASALRRLASGSLAETVNRLLLSETSEELLGTLLTLVGEGLLIGCASAVQQLAREPTTPRYARLEAIRAAAKVGSRSENEPLLRSLVDDAVQIEHEVGGAIVEAMYPSNLSLDQLLTLVERVEPPPPQTGTTLPYWLGNKVCGDTPANLRAKLLDGVLLIASAAPNQEWLLDPLAQLALHYAADNGLDRAPLLRVVRFFARLELPRMGVGDGSEEMRRLIAANPEFRRAAFWEDVAVLREAGKNPTTFFDLLAHQRLWALGVSDFDWLETDARSMPKIQDRLLAFDTVARASVRTEDEARKIDVVLRLAEAEPAFAKRRERWNRPGVPSAAMVRMQRQQRIRQERRVREHQTTLTTLKENLDNIRAGHQGCLEYLAGMSNIDGQEPDKGLVQLRKRFDAEIADAAAVGFRALWRVLDCPLPHEEPERNRWLVITTAAFAGITLDFEYGLDAQKMTTHEATRAARYATRSMNHFPAWLDRIAQSQPSALSLVLGEAVRADYQHAADQQPVYGVLHLLGHASEPVRRLCAPIVVQLLRTGDPVRFDALEQSIEVLIPTPGVHDDLRTLAEERCASLRPTTDGATASREYILWLCAWFGVAPDLAVSELERQVSAAQEGATTFVEAFSDQLYKLLNDARLEFPFTNSSDVIVRLYAVVATYVRPSKDVRHRGTFSPGPRDHAESVRTFLLDRLVAIEGDATYLGLRRLADDPRLLELRDYLLAQADQRLAQDVSKRDPDIADRLEAAFRQYGLKATDHLEEAGLKTMTSARVDFGIITALPEERDAVLAQLEGLKKLDKDGSDTHTYYEGTLASSRADGAVYRVVLVCCPSMGPEVAVQTAGALLNQWKPRHVMLVGIAMGLEGESHHGDILIADQVADYTLGKRENGKRIIRWKGSQPGASLFDSAMALGTQWNSKILVARPVAGSSAQVVGTIASGGDVVADKELVTEFVATWPRLVGIEMEAGGVATAVQHDVNKPDFLMVKSVSDHGYDKKFSEVLPWRAYAAATAATFAVELMRSGPSPAVKLR